jgi:hypothetical protein
LAATVNVAKSPAHRANRQVTELGGLKRVAMVAGLCSKGPFEK